MRAAKAGSQSFAASSRMPFSTFARVMTARAALGQFRSATALRSIFSRTFVAVRGRPLRMAAL